MKKIICLMLAMLIAFSTFSVTALAAEVADNSSELTETATDVLDKETFENLLTELAERGFFEELFMAFMESSSEIVNQEALENLLEEIFVFESSSDVFESPFDIFDEEMLENLLTVLIESSSDIINQEVLENLFAEVVESYSDIIDDEDLENLFTVFFETSSDIVDEEFLETFLTDLFETFFEDMFGGITDGIEKTVDGITYLINEELEVAYVIDFEETLTSINIPAEIDGCKVIDIFAVEAPEGVEEITLPDTLECVNSSVFTNTAFYKNADNWENGLLYIGEYLISGARWTWVDEENSEIDFQASGDITVKQGTRLIADAAFFENTEMTSIKIPSSVEIIGLSAFEGCKKLSKVELSQGLVTIDSFAFIDCPELKSIKIPSSVESIGVDAIGYFIDEEVFVTKPVEDFTIYGTADSMSQVYAQENEIEFVLDTTSAIVGDCNGDGKISVADARKIVVAIAKGDTIDLSVGDVNSDGKISVADARKLIVTIAKGENK